MTVDEDRRLFLELLGKKIAEHGWRFRSIVVAAVQIRARLIQIKSSRISGTASLEILCGPA